MKYITTTMQPAKAGSHRNAIRIGEQDSWALRSLYYGKSHSNKIGEDLDN